MIYFALTALGFVLANVLNAFAARYIPQHFLVVMHALLRRPNEWAFFNLRNGPVIFLVGPQKWLAKRGAPTAVPSMRPV